MSQPICTLCDKVAVARKLCSAHYQRQRKYGDTSIVKGRRAPTIDGGKTCPSCATWKPLEAFGPRLDTLDGRQTRCNQCVVDAHYLRKTDATDDPRQCKHCGTVYQPKHRKISVYCSPRCKDLGRRPTPPPRICPHCADALPTALRSSALFCSKRCRDAAHRLQSKLRLRTGEVAKSGYLRAEIAIRDNWTCQIIGCGLPVDRTLWYPDPWSGSLDHIIPVSRGGTSDPSNLRLAHLTCNQLRGNRSLI